MTKFHKIQLYIYSFINLYGLVSAWLQRDILEYLDYHYLHIGKLNTGDYSTIFGYIFWFLDWVIAFTFSSFALGGILILFAPVVILVVSLIIARKIKKNNGDNTTRKLFLLNAFAAVGVLVWWYIFNFSVIFYFA